MEQLDTMEYLEYNQHTWDTINNLLPETSNHIPLTDRIAAVISRQMISDDYSHPLFHLTTTEELRQHLNQLLSDYQPSGESQAFRILYDVQRLSYDGKGLRVETCWGTGSMNRPLHENVVLVKFDPSISTDHVKYDEIERFWFEI